jgi:hypothetical protein
LNVLPVSLQHQLQTHLEFPLSRFAASVAGGTSFGMFVGLELPLQYLAQLDWQARRVVLAGLDLSLQHFTPF